VGELPDWLAEFVPAEELAEGLTEEGPESEEVQDWLAELEPAAGLADEGGLEPTEVPEWLSELAPDEVEAGEPTVEEVVPEAEAEVEAEGVPAEAPEEALPAWLEEEGLPSGDDALAWLESLTAGREEELRAAAEAEAEARVAEITGRARPTEEPEAEVEEAAVPSEELPEVSPEELEVFGWTTIGEEEVPGEPVEAVTEAAPREEGFGWTEFEAEAGEELEVVEPELEEALPVEEPVAELAPEEVVPEPEEALPAEELLEQLAPEELEVVGPEEEVAVLEAEEALPVAEPVAELVSEEAEVAEPALEEEVEPEEVMPVAEPVAEPVLEEEALEPEEALPVEELLEELAPQETLALARELWQAGNHRQAVESYSHLLDSGKLEDEILGDLEARRAQRPPDSFFLRVMGDAYVRTGQLSEALRSYREALEIL
jgi:tetratricopeptide (TPR) repeat protein